MPSTPPFFDVESGTLDINQVLREAIPLTKLIGLVTGVALIPFWIAFTLELFPTVFTIFFQFVLAVGGSIVLIYVISRGIQLTET